MINLTKLFGGRGKTSFPGGNNETGEEQGEVHFYWNHLTEPVQMAALVACGAADLPMGPDGKPDMEQVKMSTLALQDDRLHVEIARRCIVAAENLAGWPQEPHTESPDGWPVLNKEALNAIPLVVRRYVLVQIGKEILSESKMSEEEGNASTSQPTGYHTDPASGSQMEATPTGSQIAPSAGNEEANP